MGDHVVKADIVSYLRLVWQTQKIWKILGPLLQGIMIWLSGSGSSGKKKNFLKRNYLGFQERFVTDIIHNLEVVSSIAVLGITADFRQTSYIFSGVTGEGSTELFAWSQRAFPPGNT